MSFFDTHCHLDFEVFKDQQDDVIAGCLEKKIERIVVPGVAESNWDVCLRLAESYPSVDVALGMHPYFISEHKEKHLNQLEQKTSARRDDIVAIGEIGLDDSRQDFERQCFYFESQLQIAEQLKLPVIMHMRRNHGQGLVRAKKYDLVGGVVHAFSGSYQDAMAWVDVGMKIGVGGVITYGRAKKTRDTIAKLPLDCLVLETDAPDMAIQGVPSGAGSPLMILDVFEALVAIRDEPKSVLEAALWSNSVDVFSN